MIKTEQEQIIKDIRDAMSFNEIQTQKIVAQKNIKKQIADLHRQAAEAQQIVDKAQKKIRKAEERLKLIINPENQRDINLLIDKLEKLNKKKKGK